MKQKWALDWTGKPKNHRRELQRDQVSGACGCIQRKVEQSCLRLGGKRLDDAESKGREVCGTTLDNF